MKDYKKLNVFEKTRHFNLELYSTTKPFPKSEDFGVTSQIRRASVSIATNIAEGCGKDSSKDLVRFLNIAYASV